MKKYLGTIFLIFGFLEIIVLSAISTFDRVMYEDTNHFIGFINNYGLWPFSNRFCNSTILWSGFDSVRI